MQKLVRNQADSSSIDYRQSISTIITALKYLQDLSEKFNLIRLFEVISDTLKNIENNSFTIAVLGEFNRGKSTFINALLGQDILPSDILATTATVSRIIYSSTTGAKIYFKDGSQQEIDISQLANYVTQLTEDSTATAAKIKEAVVYYPVACCQNNIEIIDTPGLSDNQEMTDITSAIINQCDLAIMVISAQSPFGISEGEFLTNSLLANGIYNVLFVVNRIDLFSSEDTHKIVNLVEHRIHKCIQDWAEQQPNPQEYLQKIGKIKVFGISAFQALEAKKSKNIPLLAESLFVNFEYALKILINQQRGKIKLETNLKSVINYSTEIKKNIITTVNNVSQEQENINIFRTAINNEIISLRGSKTSAVQLIDSSMKILEKQVSKSFYQLESKLKQAAKEIIESSNINTIEQTTLASQISTAVQNVTRDFTYQTQTEIQESLNVTLAQIKDLTNSLGELIVQLHESTNLLGLEAAIDSKTILICRKMISFVDALNQKKQMNFPLTFTSKPEIFVLTNGGSGVGTATGAAVGFVLLGPLGGAIGGAIGAAVGKNLQNNQSAEKYQTFVASVIDKELNLMNVRKTMDDYLSQTISEMREVQKLLIEEVNLILDNIQNLLSKNYGKCSTQITNKQQEIQQIQTEIEQIISEAQTLYQQLISTI